MGGAADSAAADAQPASSRSSLFLLHLYCHDDPKQLNDFRMAEIDALCSLAGVSVPAYDKAAVQPSSPFLVVRLPSDQIALHDMARRAILVQQWARLWAQGDSVEACLRQLAERRRGQTASASAAAAAASEEDASEEMASFAAQADIPFDVHVYVHGASLPSEEKRAHRAAVLSALGFTAEPTVGHNDLRHGARLCLFLDVGSVVANPSRRVRRVFLARIVSSGANKLEQTYRLNARACIGPTSMPPALAFLMANSAQIKPGQVALDPCVGTGALLVAAAHHGALCYGADLNQKLLTGRTRAGPTTVHDNFVQYGFVPPEILCGDLSHSPFQRRREWVDAIVCDPPYGVRAGARKLGRAPESKRFKAADGGDTSTADAHVDDESLSVSNPAYLATQLYEVDQVVHDLLAMAADVLRVGGRISYWLPTPGDDGTSAATAPGSSVQRPPPVVPSHPAMRVVSVCQQSVRLAFSRCLVTMEKQCSNTDAMRAEYASMQQQHLAADATVEGVAPASAGAAAAEADAPRAISAKHAKRLAKVAFRQQRKLQQAQGQQQQAAEAAAAAAAPEAAAAEEQG